MNRKNLFLACWYGLTPGRGWGIPVLWEGPPGGSKTSQLEGWAQELGTPFIHASPSMLGEGWFGVVPVPQMPDGSSDMVTTFPPNEDVWRINNIGRGLVLFDELRAVQNKSVQAAMLGTFQERRFANLQLAVGVRVMAASMKRTPRCASVAATCCVEPGMLVEQSITVMASRRPASRPVSPDRMASTWAEPLTHRITMSLVCATA